MSRLVGKKGLIHEKNSNYEFENRKEHLYPQRSSEKLTLKNDELDRMNFELYENQTNRYKDSSSKRLELNSNNNESLDVVDKDYVSNKKVNNIKESKIADNKVISKGNKFSLKDVDLSKVVFTDFEKAVYLTKICLDNTQLYDAVKYAEDIIFYSTTELIPEHRNLVTYSFKSYLLNKRDSYKNILIVHNKEKETHSKYSKLVAEIKISLEGKILNACERQITLLNKHIMPKVLTLEGKADFLKLKADIYRYLCEISSGELLQINKENCTQLYKDCIKVCDDLSPLSNIRAGAYLNFSVYCYEILQNPYFSLSYSTKGLKSAIQELSLLEKNNKNECSKVKDTLEILHVLKENITEWYNEIESKENHSALALTKDKNYFKIIKELHPKKNV